MEFTEFEHNDNWKIKRFPCSCCLVKPACNDYISCELIEQNKNKIYKLVKKERKCPDCGIKINSITKIIPIIDYSFECSCCEHIFRVSFKYKMGYRGEYHTRHISK